MESGVGVLRSAVLVGIDWVCISSGVERDRL